MEYYTTYTPFYAVAVSLVAVPLILLSNKHPNIRETWTILAAVLKFLLVLSLLPALFDNKVAIVTLVDLSPGISLTLKADAAGVFFALVASFLWILTSFYSIGYERELNEHKQTRYFASFAICLSATIGIAFSANLLTFLLFYEILTIATYPLVIHKETSEAVSGGRKYLLYTLSAGVVLIAATAWLYTKTGTLDFVAGGAIGNAVLGDTEIRTLFLLFILGVGVKAAIMPLHSWLPTAMVAPTPVSALLHAVAVVKSGVFGVIRIVGFIFGPSVMQNYGLDVILLFFSSATIIIASLLAFAQTNLKRLLAYSTIGHLSYIVLGAALLTPASFQGALLHLLNHATLKITLFFCAGAFYVAHHVEELEDINGIATAMPLTSAAFTLTALGLVGIPPINGFLSKWYLTSGALESHNPVLIAVFLLSGLLNAGYFIPVIYRAFFLKNSHYTSYKEASYFMVIPLLITAILSVLLGIFPNMFVNIFEIAKIVVASVFGVL